VLRVLVDADNVAPRRVQAVLSALSTIADEVRLTASGSSAALARVRWPGGAELIPTSGWQRADVALAEAYTATDDPLVLVSGDGDFGLLAGRHPGPVLVVSGAPSGRLRDGTTVLDPAVDGIEAITAWLRTNGVTLVASADQRSGERRDRPPM
jgi:hypothetical protein